MNPFLIAAFLVGLLLGSVPTIGWYKWCEIKEENNVLKDNIRLEKKNVETVTAYTDAIHSISTYYSKHPVRVLLPTGNKDCPGGTTTTAENIILTIPGYQRDYGTATDSGLHINDDTNTVSN